MNTVKSTEYVDLPDGEYQGTLGGWAATVVKGNRKINFSVSMGIRTPAEPVKIVVNKHSAEVTPTR